MSPKKILITGASGLIGQNLTKLLIQKDYQVASLGRKKASTGASFIWDISKNFVEPGAVEWADAIIHLAGASVFEKRWTAEWKKQIRESRTLSTRLLFETLKKQNHRVKTFISASAIGYYGVSLTDELLFEESKAGDDFMAEVVKAWEDEADNLAGLGIRTVKLRTGIVLSEQGGALREMVKPIKWFVGSPLGSGKQYISWIHMEDLCRMFLHVLERENLQGAFNATGSKASTNKELTEAIARHLNKPLLLPNVPRFVLKIVLGEIGESIVMGSNVSSQKIQQTGFEVMYKNLDDALANLLPKYK